MTSLVRPCPWCGEVPAIEERSFVYTDTFKWGALSCCGTGPEVRTNYESWESWKNDAIEQWNNRDGSLEDLERLKKYDTALANLIEAIIIFRADLLKHWQPAPCIDGKERWPPSIARKVSELDAALEKAKNIQNLK